MDFRGYIVLILNVEGVSYHRIYSSSSYSLSDGTPGRWTFEGLDGLSSRDLRRNTGSRVCKDNLMAGFQARLVLRRPINWHHVVFIETLMSFTHGVLPTKFVMWVQYPAHLLRVNDIRL